MKLIVSGVHMKLSEPLKGYVEEHLARPLERFCDDEAAELEVHLVADGDKRGSEKECRATLRIPGLSPLHVTEVSDDLRKSVDLVRDRLERVTKRAIEKRRGSNGHVESHPLAERAIAEEGR